MAELYLLSDNAKLAEAEFKQVLVSSPSSLRALMGLGKTLMSMVGGVTIATCDDAILQDQHASAISFFSRCEMLAVNDEERADAVMNRCHALVAMGSAKKALNTLKSKSSEWKMDGESDMVSSDGFVRHYEWLFRRAN